MVPETLEVHDRAIPAEARVVLDARRLGKEMRDAPSRVAVSLRNMLVFEGE